MDTNPSKVTHPVFYTKIKHDFGNWFEFENVQGRWFCNNHGLSNGDHVKIIIVKVPANATEPTTTR